MGVPIVSLPAVTESTLSNNHLLIVEETVNGLAETQRTTLGDLYKWLNLEDKVFNIDPSKLSTSKNFIKDVDNNIINLSLVIPEWSATETYSVNTLIKYNNNLYIARRDNFGANVSDEISWEKIGYKIGKNLKLSSDNILSSTGLSLWEPKEYDINDLVIYGDKIYRCISNNNDNSWNVEKWNVISGDGILTYTNETTYNAGTIVIKDNQLYQRIGTGTDIAWTEQNWMPITGTETNIFIKYSQNYPTSNSDISDVPNNYLGLYIGPAEIAPEDFNQYNWSKIRAEEKYVNVDSNVVVITLELIASDWTTSEPYTQTIINNELTENMYPIVDIAYSNDETNWSQELKNYSKISRVMIENGQATFYCINDRPTENFKVKLRINGDVNANSFVTKEDFQTLVQEIDEANTTLQNILEGY